MKRFVRFARLAAAGAAALSVVSMMPVALAQDFPSKPIRFVLPTSPGGVGDQLTRLISQKLQERMGQSVVVEYKAGSGGVIGMQAGAQAPKDGYTITMTWVGAAIVNPIIVKNAEYDTLRDFAPLSLAVTFPTVLSVRNELPVRTVQELIAYAKANPGKLNYGSAGNATAPHLTTELLRQETGIDIVHIPFKGAGPAMLEFLAGRVDIYFDSLTIMKQNLSSGKYRMLGIATKKRSSLAPEIPTLDEGGLKGFESVGWFGVLAPAGTPQPVTDRLSREIGAIVRDTDMQKRLRDMGLEPVGSSAAEFRELIRQENALWSRTVKAANIRSD
jgi:tripartite-type tricarboxylate transporter receptor subunit TctC